MMLDDERISAVLRTEFSTRVIIGKSTTMTRRHMNPNRLQRANVLCVCITLLQDESRSDGLAPQTPRNGGTRYRCERWRRSRVIAKIISTIIVKNEIDAPMPTSLRENVYL